MTEQAAGLAVRKAIFVNLPVPEAFMVFTDGIATWWPLPTHSVSGDGATGVVLEGRVGGRLFESASSGAEHDWGVVTAWTPPNMVRFTWHPGRPAETYQEVEVRFTPEGDGTRVELVHTGWERLGDNAADAARDYDRGWDKVLGYYVETTG
jgi:uncharacterized protein YndB with AHSA1/START domain